MADTDNPLSDDQIRGIADQVEKEVTRKYKQKFVGTIAGITVAFAIIGFFGWSNLKDAVSDKVVKNLLNEKFKKEVSKAVSDSVLAKSDKMVSQMAKSKVRADSILADIERQHDAVLEAATSEFGRTIEVLKTVRDKAVTQK